MLKVGAQAYNGIYMSPEIARKHPIERKLLSANAKLYLPMREGLLHSEHPSSYSAWACWWQ
jgi:hypothetical protein